MAKKWFKLDTAALIFPAAMTGNWSNCFRLSAQMSEPVDPAILQQAVNELKDRFPSFYVRLQPGFFWFRLEDAGTVPVVRQDYAYPLTHMGKKELKTICFRVLYYRDRIAAEFFHSITDGTGGSVYFRNLLFRYAEIKYGSIGERGCGVVSIAEPPAAAELKESFFENSCGYAAPRVTEKAYRMRGTRLPSGRKHLITGTAEAEKVLETAHKYGVSVTAFISAVMLESIIRVQKEDRRGRRGPVKISLPVNLRKLYGSSTLRNFVLALDIGADTRLGDYTLEDLCSCVSHQLKYMATPQYMRGQIASNTMPQKNLLIRLVPLPIKSAIMNLVYTLHGERGSCIALSNLGNVDLPSGLRPYIRNLDFIIGVQRSYPNNCSVISTGGVTRINIIRNIEETRLEQLFFSRLVELGIPVSVRADR